MRASLHWLTLYMTGKTSFWTVSPKLYIWAGIRLSAWLLNLKACYSIGGCWKRNLLINKDWSLPNILFILFAQWAYPKHYFPCLISFGFCELVRVLKLYSFISYRTSHINNSHNKCNFKRLLGYASIACSRFLFDPKYPIKYHILQFIFESSYPPKALNKQVHDKFNLFHSNNSPRTINSNDLLRILANSVGVLNKR